VAEELTPGQRQALDELERISAAADGAITVRLLGLDEDEDALAMELVLDCADVEPSNGGVHLAAREAVRVFIPERFPFAYPWAKVPHGRFADLPHVQWRHEVCLYQAPETEWVPGDGMYGFLDRLIEWYARAATGTLDLPGEPLHPPVAYSAPASGRVVVHANAPQAAGADPWRGFAVLRSLGRDRADVVGWLPLDKVAPQGRTTEPALAARLTSLVGDGEMLLGLAVVLPRPLSFEYPRTAAALLEALTAQGVTDDELLVLLGMTALYNDLLAGRADNAVGDARQWAWPIYVFVGTPMRGIAGRPDRLTDLAAWRLPAIGSGLAADLSEWFYDDPARARVGEAAAGQLRAWLAGQETAWEVIYEDRPEIVTRRDADSPASWLRGRRILVLGCGALGAPIAEQCVRAGAAWVLVADRDNVSPGILVRQPYADADVGWPKAQVLAERLDRIQPDATRVNSVVGDALGVLDWLDAQLRTGEEAPVDLLVDATANLTVAARLESLRWPMRDRWPAVVSVAIGHRAERGVATVSLPGASGGGMDILRRLGVNRRLGDVERLRDVVDDLFPDPPRTATFQPEPGCSAPTFIGSAAEVSALAAALFSSALGTLSAHEAGMTEPMSLHITRLADNRAAVTPPPERLTWWNDLLTRDPASGFEVRVTAAALDRMYSEVVASGDLLGDRVETGGLLLGHADGAARVVWVDVASGPPPDSERSSERFRHGVEGVKELIADVEARSAQLVRFLGMWHTHPYGSASPSDIDQQAMSALLASQDRAPNPAVLMVLGGSAPTWSAFLNGVGPPDVSAHVTLGITQNRLAGSYREF
jgi:integrative and conjugative element protein (TIGR02256 family)